MRALDVLDAIAHEPSSLTHLAQKVGLHPSTTFRMLESLRARGLARRTSEGTYELGIRTLELAGNYLRRMSVSSYAQEAVERLARAVKESASIGTLVDGQVLYVAIAEGQHELGIRSVPFARHPAHCTALGKVLLAYARQPDVLEFFARQPLTRHTANTIVDNDDLERELEQVAALGFAADNEECVEGMICLAAPIRDHTNNVTAAISINEPAFRVVAHGIEKSLPS